MAYKTATFFGKLNTFCITGENTDTISFFNMFYTLTQGRLCNKKLLSCTRKTSEVSDSCNVTKIINVHRNPSPRFIYLFQEQVLLYNDNCQFTNTFGKKRQCDKIGQKTDKKRNVYIQQTELKMCQFSNRSAQMCNLGKEGYPRYNTIIKKTWPSS